MTYMCHYQGNIKQQPESFSHTHKPWKLVLLFEFGDESPKGN